MSAKRLVDETAVASVGPPDLAALDMHRWLIRIVITIGRFHCTSNVWTRGSLVPRPFALIVGEKGLGATVT